MSTVFNSERISPTELFKQFSKSDGKIFYGYSKDFQIDRVGAGKEKEYVITQTSKASFLNPFKVRTPDDRKVTTANNLCDLVKRYAEKVVQQPQYDSEQVIKTLKRCQIAVESSMKSPDTRDCIGKVYAKAIAILEDVRRKHEMEIARGRRIDPKGKTRWETDSFLEKMAKTWRTPTGRPNFRIHISKTSKDELQIYTSGKPYWISKQIGERLGKEPTSDLKKLAVMKNLLELFQKQKACILGGSGAKGILENVERLAARMRSNMHPTNRQRFDDTLGKISRVLRQYQDIIDQRVHWNPLWYMGKAVECSIGYAGAAIRGAVELPFRATVWSVKLPFRAAYVLWRELGHPLLEEVRDLLWTRPIEKLATYRLGKLAIAFFRVVGWGLRPLVVFIGRPVDIATGAADAVVDRVRRIVNAWIRVGA